MQKCRQLLGRSIPARAPVAVHAKAKANRINFLSHNFSTTKLLVRFLDRLFRSRLFLSFRSFRRVASCGFFLLFGSSFRFLFRLSSLACLYLNLVGEYDSNMTGPLQNAAGAAPGTRHDPLECRALAHNRFLSDQSVRLKVSVVLGIGDRTF